MNKPIIFSFCIFLAGSLWNDCKAEELTQDDIAFEERVIHAIDAHDSAWLAEHISYPISVYIDGNKVSIKNKSKFLELYEDIINKNVIGSLGKYGNSDGFKNYQGLMLGNGAVWIWEIKEDGQESK